RYEQIAAGSSWVGEYGSVSVPEERKFLASISPYSNLKSGVQYPQALIWSTTKDDRVGPQHARKFAAKLSAMGVPYHYFEVIEGGHGAGATPLEQAEIREHHAHAFGQPRRITEMQELIGAMRVGMRSEHAGHEELRLWKALAEHS